MNGRSENSQGKRTCENSSSWLGECLIMLHYILLKVLSGGMGVDFLVGYLLVFQAEWEVWGLLFDIFLPQ